MDNIIRGFQNPPAQYRPAPLWVWNDEMTKEQIAFQLKELATHGFGGAFVHPRPGLVTEYLSDEWFEMWGYALEKAKELGIKLYIYDENSYPSGFAGGHVSAMCPEALATIMRCQVIDWNTCGLMFPIRLLRLSSPIMSIISGQPLICFLPII